MGQYELLKKNGSAGMIVPQVRVSLPQQSWNADLPGGVSSTHLREHTSMLPLRGNVGWAALKQSITRALAAYAASPFLIERM